MSLKKLIYKTWQNMKTRCYNPKHRSYKDYAGRGITICDEWLNSFEDFYEWAINNGYEPNLSIERVNNDWIYCPENCKFIPRNEQPKNTRKSKPITAFGESKVASDWAKDPRCKVSRKTLLGRLKWGWEPEKAITEDLIQDKREVVGITFDKSKRTSPWIVRLYIHNNGTCKHFGSFKTKEEALNRLQEVKTSLSIG